MFMFLTLYTPPNTLAAIYILLVNCFIEEGKLKLSPDSICLMWLEILQMRAVRPHEEDTAWMKQLKNYVAAKSHLRVKRNQRGGNSQHCQFKKWEDEKKSHYLRKIGMLSRVAKTPKRKKNIIRKSISSIIVESRRRDRRQTDRDRRKIINW